MFTSVNEFLNEWKYEAAVTQKVLDDETRRLECSSRIWSYQRRMGSN
ncbi:hypothetical protein HPT25_22980 [Bacillus sp. BRMEA1]|nr:hypothetical protein [Neobacillus endophyticus]NRD80200.1 hypothetical protein [Neobacillus endophyticus]